MFKKLQQLRNFDKRVIWPQDRSFKDLADEALLGFMASQDHFLLPQPMSRRASLVLHHAANLCQLVLGEFSYDEWFGSCSYGKRAALDLPRARAYLDERMYSSSGTRAQHAAFNECLSHDVHLLRAVRTKRRLRKQFSQIKATAVPKSFKSARIIAPDTILGGFLSRGLGEYIRKQLEKETHIDLAKQQERHRLWAQQASVTGRYATIDMSKASDSFVWDHIEALVPKSWHPALQCVRTGFVEVKLSGGSEFRGPLRSYMLMGSGHTFPLQTLLFWCLAEATRSLMNVRGRVSVYGDDIIIPVKTSRAFMSVMTELGFTVNSEKSFFDEPDPDKPSHTFFRESCGGDYKGGVDVRPYMPECDLQENRNVSPNEFIGWCHKVINGLLDRWDPCELPVTLGFLLRTLDSKSRKICFVPAWEVDHAGIRHYLPPHLLFGYEVSRVTYEKSHPSYWKLVYRETKRARKMKERPYIWYAYFLKRNNAAPRFKLPVLFELLREEYERSRKIKEYEIEVSLSGEPNRSRKGKYRWVNFGPGNWK
jgi:hypothetical protein